MFDARSVAPAQVGSAPARRPVRLQGADGLVGALLLKVLPLLWLSGCLAHQGPTRDWLVYARDPRGAGEGVPVARVTLAGASHGNVVDVALRGGTAEVTLRHRGQATLTPVPVPPGVKVALREVDVRALARGEYDEVERALGEATPGHADDTARDVLQATADEELARALQSERGRRAVARLYSALTDGSLWDDEREQARRVLMAYAERIGPERVARAIEDERTKVVPLRGFGATVASPVSVRVELAGDGLDVFVNTKVYDYPESKTLPLDWLRFHVGYDEVVGLRLYDEGGATRFAPALYLVEVAHQDARRTLLKCGEAFAFGVTLAGGAVGAAGATGGRLVTTLVWCDRAAVALGAVTSVVDEHRGWILERYGEKGARFLRYSDGLSTLVAFYAVGRLATAAPTVLLNLRRAYLDMKALKAALSAEERATLDLLGRRTEEALQAVERGADIIPIGRAKARQPALRMEEVEIRATGTEGKLVPVGEGPSRPGTVASAGEGGGNRPLRAAPSSSSAGTRAVDGRGGGTVVAATASAESEIAAALRGKGLSEQQARAVAQFAAENGVLENVQALVKSPGYKNPEKLPKFLNDWNPKTEGKVQALEDAVARLRAKHQVALEGGGADVVDYTTREAIQHKRIFGEGKDALGDDLIEAAKQLRGAGGEVPPEGFKRVIDVRFDPTSSHPLKGGDRNAVRAAFPDRDRLKGVDRVLITTDKGRFEFDPPFPLH